MKLCQFSEDGDIKKFFYHTPKTNELDNLLGDIYHKILGMNAPSKTRRFLVAPFFSEG